MSDQEWLSGPEFDTSPHQDGVSPAAEVSPPDDSVYWTAIAEDMSRPPSLTPTNLGDQSRADRVISSPGVQRRIAEDLARRPKQPVLLSRDEFRKRFYKQTPGTPEPEDASQNSTPEQDGSA